MSSESCHCLTTPYSNTSTSSSPSSRTSESLWWFHSKCIWFCWLPRHQCAHRLRLRSPGLIFFLSSCGVWHTLIWPRHRNLAGHGNGYYSGWDTGDICRGSCPFRALTYADAKLFSIQMFCIRSATFISYKPVNQKSECLCRAPLPAALAKHLKILLIFGWPFSAALRVNQLKSLARFK